MSTLSVATIKDPEFINLKKSDVSPLMSECEIKVLYTGGNRNRSFISKETATEMSKTLRGCPIVGWFKKDKEDFLDHGNEITINGEGIDFKVKTKPYGFVAPDAKVWFQEFEETDDFGNKVIREYLMTTGYLWTEQYEESKKIIEEGRPHSMELDEKTLDGKWAENSKTGIEFFIINDALFSKLCILGTDIEPCFEGSSITAPNISKDFSKKDENFDYKTLYQMMEHLNYALKGGKQMHDENQKELTQEPEENTSEYACGGGSGKKDEKKKYAEDEKKKKEEEKDKPDDSKMDDEEKKKKEKENKEMTNHSFDEEKYSLLEKQYNELKTQCEELLAFKKDVDKKKKEELIDSFYMLSDEDKKDVKENIDKYSYDDIESKLAVICVRKKVNFEVEDSQKKEEHEDPAVTFNLNEGDSVPAWISAVKKNKDKREK